MTKKGKELSAPGLFESAFRALNNSVLEAVFAGLIAVSNCCCVGEVLVWVTEFEGLNRKDPYWTPFLLKYRYREGPEACVV
jgi:hypothetical protein